MSVISQVQAEHKSPFMAVASVQHIDGRKMIHRLCKHFSHKIDAGWNDNQGYIEFAMGVCDMSADEQAIHLHCGSGSQAELDEIVDCINVHFQRFAKSFDFTLHWNYNHKS